MRKKDNDKIIKKLDEILTIIKEIQGDSLKPRGIGLVMDLRKDLNNERQISRCR